MILTAKRARELLSYNPQSGEVRWKVRVGSRAPAGSMAGAVVCPVSGYRNVRLDKKLYRLHRVIWLMQTGAWPFQIDHRNRDRADNHWDNLRETCDALNRQNVEKARNDSATGVQGVHVHPKTGMFVAGIRRDRRYFYLGAYESMEEARSAYLSAKAQLHPAWVPSGDALSGVRLTENHLLADRGVRRVRSDSTSGIVGVRAYMGRWVARCNRRHVGVFDTAESAYAAYMAAKQSASALRSNEV